MTKAHLSSNNTSELADLLKKAEAYRLRYGIKILSIILAILLIATIATHLYIPNLPLLSLMQLLLLSIVLLLLLYTLFSIGIPKTAKLLLTLILFVVLATLLETDKTNAIFMLSIGPVIVLFIGHFGREHYQRSFRNDLMHSMVKRCDPSAKYFPERVLTLTRNIHSPETSLFPHIIHEYDKISALTKGIGYEYTYTTAQYGTETFNGILMTARLPDICQIPLLLGAFEAVTLEQFKAFKTGEPEFDQAFHAFSPKNQKAKNLLNSTVRQELLMLYRDFPKHFIMEIHDKNITLFFAFPYCLRPLPILHNLLSCKGLEIYPCLGQRFESILYALAKGMTDNEKPL